MKVCEEDELWTGWRMSLWTLSIRTSDPGRNGARWAIWANKPKKRKKSQNSPYVVWSGYRRTEGEGCMGQSVSPMASDRTTTGTWQEAVLQL